MKDTAATELEEEFTEEAETLNATPCDVIPGSNPGRRCELLELHIFSDERG